MPWPCASGEELTHERLLSLVHYNPKTGVFTRLVSTAPRAMAGSIFAGSLDSKGYMRFRIDGKVYSAHRVAWFYMTGAWPIGEIDHKNLKRDENWWDNLRLADSQSNKWNRGAYVNNQSGFKGVSYRSANRNWISRIRINEKEVHLGVFQSPEAAHAAYIAKAKEAFGEFARASVDDPLPSHEVNNAV
jgi:hypothetical protein